MYYKRTLGKIVAIMIVLSLIVSVRPTDSINASEKSDPEMERKIPISPKDDQQYDKPNDFFLAQKNYYQDLAEYANMWFDTNGYGKHLISNPFELYSLRGDTIAVMFTIDQLGYVIINLINYDIMEFSFDSCPNLEKTRHAVYNGFLGLYSEEKGLRKDSTSAPSGEAIDFWEDKRTLNQISLHEKLEQLVGSG